jgi:hypothetical protein
VSQQQWCVVRGCVALADSKDVPWLCAIHGAMSQTERRQWSDEHAFNLPVLKAVDGGRVVYQRPDGSCYTLGETGERIEEPR